MSKKEDKIIFTDLDGTLLDEDYSFKKAESALNLLKEKNIPLIICTSKTRAEIEYFRRRLKNNHPFISENGGAIFIPENYFKTKFHYDKKISGYRVIELGKKHKEIIDVFKKIQKNSNVQLIGFSEMSIQEIKKDSGLNELQARLSKKREYDEPFKLYGNEKEKRRILKKIKKSGFNYTKGGKYYHILGDNNKGKAMKILEKIYFNEGLKNIQLIALGDSKNDKEMLEKADIGFLVQKPDKSYSGIKSLNVKKIKGVGPEGWNRAVLDLFFEFNEKRANELYKSSVEIIKKFQLKNGAILASSPKGRYPFVYPRDHAICILALIEAGLKKRAKKALEFILDNQSKDGSFPQRLNRNGRDASYKPIQLDNTGLILYCFVRYIKKTNDKKFKSRYKKKIKKSVVYLESKITRNNLFFTPNSIHEFPPYEEGQEIWANAVCFSALKELKEIGISTKLNLLKIKSSIENHFWNGKYFVKNIRMAESSSVASEIDASAYALGFFKVFKDDNLKIEKTVDEIEKKLWSQELGGLCRYPKHIGRNNGGYGPWPHFTLMICNHFINSRKRKKAEKYIEWVLDVSLNNQLPEHIATKKEFEEWVKEYKKAGIIRKDRQIMIDNIRKTPAYKKGLAYSVLPLVWPHAQFVLTWLNFKKEFLR